MTEKVPFKIEGRAGGPMMTNSYRVEETASGQWAFVDPTYEVEQTWVDQLAKAEPPRATTWGSEDSDLQAAPKEDTPADSGGLEEAPGEDFGEEADQRSPPSPGTALRSSSAEA